MEEYHRFNQRLWGYSIVWVKIILINSIIKHLLPVTYNNLGIYGSRVIIIIYIITYITIFVIIYLKINFQSKQITKHL